MCQRLTKKKRNPKNSPPKKTTHRLLLNFQAFTLHPPFLAELSLQADHVPEYHRSLSSHSLRSCNLLRPQCQKASRSLVVVCSWFFNILLKGRGTQSGCYHHTYFHFPVLVAACSLIGTKLQFNKLWLFPPSALFKMTCTEMVCICSFGLKCNYWAGTAKFQPTANSYNRALTLQNRDC